MGACASVLCSASNEASNKFKCDSTMIRKALSKSLASRGYSLKDSLQALIDSNDNVDIALKLLRDRQPMFRRSYIIKVLESDLISDMDCLCALNESKGQLHAAVNILVTKAKNKRKFFKKQL